MAPSRIVVASDLTARSDRAVERATALAVQWGAKLFAVHAIEHTLAVPDVPAWHKRLDPVALARERLRADLREYAKDAELIVERRNAASLVLDVATEVGADVIVTGVARDEFLGTAKLGSTVETLARSAPIPLLVVKLRPHDSYRHVVVGSNFSKGSHSALVTAIELCADALITLFHAFELPYASYAHDRTAFRASGRASVEAEAREHLRRSALERSNIRILAEYGSPDHLLAELTRATNVDLVVVGRERGRVAALLLGSVSRSVLIHAPTDVMVVPARTMEATTQPGVATPG
jgi:nucleotide-binding universal stress UspA family protein